MVRPHTALLLLVPAAASCGSSPTDSGPPGSPASLTWEGLDGRGATVGNFVATPSIRVRDQGGRPVPGVVVDFDADGAGLLGRAADTTDSDGLATPAAWRLGQQAGSQHLHASAGSLTASATVDAAPPPAPGFHIEVIFSGDPPKPSEAAEVASAAARWEALVLGDLPNLTIHDTPKECPELLLFQGHVVDDILVFVSLTALPPPAIGRTAVCVRRDGGGLPAVAKIEIDRNNAPLTAGLRQTILHELAHALGFGTIWDAPLLRDRNGDLRFLGRSTEAAYWFSAGPGANAPSAGVPVEASGSAAIARSHWREAVLQSELMTPFSTPAANGPVEQPLSAITVSALRDIGYVVDDSRADPFSIVPAASLRQAPAPSEILQPFRPMVVDQGGREVKKPH